jgi:hypothetical protein
LKQILSDAFQAVSASGSKRSSKYEFKRRSEYRIVDHDLSIITGDFNSRLVIGKDEQSLPPQDEWLPLDQMLTGAFASLQGFREGLITFPPTYKYHLGSDELNMKRLPAWCDRVVYKAEEKVVDVDLVQYESYKLKLTSDHHPIAAQFTVAPVTRCASDAAPAVSSGYPAASNSSTKSSVIALPDMSPSNGAAASPGSPVQSQPGAASSPPTAPKSLVRESWTQSDAASSPVRSKIPTFCVDEWLASESPTPAVVQSQAEAGSDPLPIAKTDSDSLPMRTLATFFADEGLAKQGPTSAGAVSTSEESWPSAPKAAPTAATDPWSDADKIWPPEEAAFNSPANAAKDPWSSQSSACWGVDLQKLKEEQHQKNSKGASG